MRAWASRAAVTLMVIAVPLAFAPLASADYDPLGSGATRLTLDASFLATLKRNRVELSAVAPAKLVAGTVTMPISGGKFDPISAKGTIEHEGALLFRRGSRSIPIKALRLKTTQRRSPLSAKVGGSQLKLASAGVLAVSREGFGERIGIPALALSSKLATRLGKKLRLKGVFEEGQPLGRSLTRVRPETIAVPGRGRAEMTLDPAFEAKLASRFVAVNPIFPAEHFGPVFTLPIFGGAIAPDGSAGVIETSGALELLQLGRGQVFFDQAWFDLEGRALSAEMDVEPVPAFPGKLGRVGVFDLGIASVSANPQTRGVAVTAALALRAEAARSLNEAFADGEEAFKAGEAAARLSFIAQAQ